MKKTALFISVAVLSFLMVDSLFAQEREHRRGRDSDRQGQAEPRRQQPPEGRAEPRREAPPPQRGEQERPRAEPRREAPPPPQRGGQDRGRAEQRRQPPPPRDGHVEQRREPPSQSREHAVPRARPLPRPHPQFGPYRRMTYQGRHYFWRPYPWPGRNVCVAGYWDWDYDSFYNEWIPVWIQGYCNIPGYRPHYSGFYFWFDFGR